MARQPRSDQGRRRRLTPELEQFAEGLALQRPRLSVATIHRHVCDRARAQGAKPPSYDVVYDVVRHLPAGLTTLAHEGGKAYSQRFDLVHRREAPAPNAIWQADHCQLDILLVREGKAPAKPWLTVVQDDYSRAIAGYFLSLDAPCTLHTALALRQAIWRKAEAQWHICGIPAVLYTDHGSDFTSKHLEQVAADLKVQLVFSLPGQPRGRGRIERFFHQGRFLCRAICPELAGETVSLREILQARRGRRRELRQTLQERQRTVDALLEVRRGATPAMKAEPEAEAPQPPAELPRLKRYFNE